LSLLLLVIVGAKEIKNNRFLTITGNAEHFVNTSMTEFSISVNAEKKLNPLSESAFCATSDSTKAALKDLAISAQQQAAELTEQVTRFLDEKPYVTNLQATGTGVRLQQLFYTRDNQRILQGYSARNAFTFRVENAHVSGLISAIVSKGVTNIDRASFVALDEDIRLARDIALKKASKQAVREAKAILDSLGLTQKEIVDVQGGSSVVGPYRFNANQVMAVEQSPSAISAAAPFLNSEQKVTASVTLKISY